MGLRAQQVGLQAHCLRREMAVDFAGTLQRVRSMGFERIELCSFRGCAGNPWGDFGELADWQPDEIRSALDAAQIGSTAAHVTHAELAANKFDPTINWVRDVGCRVIVLAALPVPPEPTLPAWQDAFASLNLIGAEIAARGMEFAYHTQNDVWQTIDDTLLADELFRQVDANVCRIELDPSGAIVSGADWQAVVSRNRGRFFAMHLRDGRQPPEKVPYLPALPLGEGEIDWQSAIQNSSAAGISDYYLEMEVDQEHDVFGALDDSLAHLVARGILTGASR
jgi:sugar phosphate isomerase/epimerase